jgi:hypothetical protein
LFFSLSKVTHLKLPLSFFANHRVTITFATELTAKDVYYPIYKLPLNFSSLTYSIPLDA